MITLWFYETFWKISFLVTSHASITLNNPLFNAYDFFFLSPRFIFFYPNKLQTRAVILPSCENLKAISSYFSGNFLQSNIFFSVSLFSRVFFYSSKWFLSDLFLFSPFLLSTLLGSFLAGYLVIHNRCSTLSSSVQLDILILWRHFSIFTVL